MSWTHSLDRCIKVKYTSSVCTEWLNTTYTQKTDTNPKYFASSKMTCSRQMGNILLANNYSKESVFTILFREFVKNYSCIFAGQENVNMARSLHTDHKSRKKIFSNTIACSVRPSLNCRDKFSTTNNTPTRLDLHKKGINYTWIK